MKRAVVYVLLSKTIVYVLNFFILIEVEADQQVTPTLI